MEKEYSSLIISDNYGVRSRLREALNAVYQIGECYQRSTPQAAVQFINDEGKVDIIFLSETLGSEAILDFLERAMKMESAKDALFVLVTGASSYRSSATPFELLAGVDETVEEPFSVDQLMCLPQQVQVVREERKLAREKTALTLLTEDMMEQLDLLATLKSLGYEASATMEGFRKACSVLPKLQGDTEELYYDIALQMYPQATVPETSKRQLYTGISRRLKKRIERKLQEKLKEESAERRQQVVVNG